MPYSPQSIEFAETDDDAPAAEPILPEIQLSSAELDDILSDMAEAAPPIEAPPPPPAESPPTVDSDISPASANAELQTFINNLIQGLHVPDAIRNNPNLLTCITMLRVMGFRRELMRRSISSIPEFDADAILQPAVMVERCLYFDSLGRIPSRLLQDTSLENATFVGSRVVSLRHRMTYKVAEFDRENACVFLIPIMYQTFNWGRSSSKAFWMPLNSPDLTFEFISHMKSNPVWDESNNTWHKLPTFTIDTNALPHTYQNKSWDDIVEHYKRVSFPQPGVLHDLYKLSSKTSIFASKSFPIYRRYRYNDSYHRFRDSIVQHMVCVCEIHGLSIDDLKNAIENNDRECFVAWGHGLDNMYDELHDYRDTYNRKHEDWLARCLPMARIDVKFNWTTKQADVEVELSDKVDYVFPDSQSRIIFAQIMSRAFAPQLYNSAYVINVGGIVGGISTNSACTLAKLRRKKKKKKSSELLLTTAKKLRPHQRDILQFLVDKATNSKHSGWYKYVSGDSKILFSTGGHLKIMGLNDNDETYLKSHSPCGAIAVQQPKSGKSVIAACFAMELCERNRKTYGRTFKAIIIVNKCVQGFLDNIEPFVQDWRFTFKKWRKSEDHVDELSYRNVTKMKQAGIIFVVSASQVKTDMRIRNVNWDAIALDDAHAYANNRSVIEGIHAINLLRKPICIVTQNEEWKLHEFNFYMHLINYTGFHIDRLSYARFVANGSYGRYTMPVNLRRRILRNQCIKDNTTLRKGGEGYEITTKIVQQVDSDLTKVLYEKKEKQAKHGSKTSALLHFAATDISMLPVKEFSKLSPKMLPNGIAMYRQRLQDACVDLDDTKEAEKNTKRKLECIVEKKDGDDNNCPICLCPIDTAVILNCNHIFCKDCMQTNTAHSKRCPLCRKEVKILKEIDEDAEPTLPTGKNGGIVEKALVEKWEKMKDTIKCPKVNEILKISKKKKCVAVYSRFKKISANLYERLKRESGDKLHVYALKTYNGYTHQQPNIAKHVAKGAHVIMVVYPAVAKSPVTIEDCNMIVANEPFLNLTEKRQVVSRFISMDKAPPPITVLKTNGSIDMAGSNLRSNTESGLVSDFFIKMARKDMDQPHTDNVIGILI